MNNRIEQIIGNIITKIVIVIIIIVSLVALYFYLWFQVGISNLQKQHEKNKEIELQNREDNTKIFNKYIENTYGIIRDTFEIDIKPAVINHDTVFVIKVPFMEKSFGISIDTDNRKIYQDNFYEVLSNDSKFQHLYSEWVKKQVGIEDDNIELKFTGNFDKPYIEFDKITTLSEDYREVFENTHNLYAKYCEASNLKELNENNKFEIAERIRNNYLTNAMKFTSIVSDEQAFTGHIYLSSGNFDKTIDKNFKFVFDAKNPESKLTERNY